MPRVAHVFAFCLATAVAIAAGPIAAMPFNVSAGVKTQPLHFAATVIPLFGHFAPLCAIAERLVQRGNYVTFFLEEPQWCTASPLAASHPAQWHCVGVPRGPQFKVATYEHASSMEPHDSMQLMFDEMRAHRHTQLAAWLAAAREAHSARPFDAVVTDMSTYIGADLSAAFHVPRASVYPLVMTLSGTHLPDVPPLGTGWGRVMGLGERAMAMFLKAVVPLVLNPMVADANALRVEHGIADVLNLDVRDLGGMNDVVLAPTIWGYDVPIAVAPNVRPLGILEPLQRVEDAALGSDLSELFDRPECALNTVYVNFGTLAVLSPQTFAAIAAGLLRLAVEHGACVVWKVAPGAQLQTAERDVVARAPYPERIVVRTRFPATRPIYKRARVFVSHCGDTSLGEAVAAGIPIAGLAIFADQPDVCQRLAERGLGVVLGPRDSVSVDDVVSRVAPLLRDGAARDAALDALRETRDIALWLGGAEEGARVVEESVRRSFGKLLAPIPLAQVEGEIPVASAGVFALRHFLNLQVDLVLASALWHSCVVLVFFTALRALVRKLF